jgi:hypothetical protein
MVSDKVAVLAGNCMGAIPDGYELGPKNSVKNYMSAKVGWAIREALSFRAH